MSREVSPGSTSDRALGRLIPIAVLGSGLLAGCSGFHLPGAAEPEGVSHLPPLAAAASQAQGESPARADFSGTWTLNRELSDDLNRKLRDAREGEQRRTQRIKSDDGQRGWGQSRDKLDRTPATEGARIDLPETLRLRQEPDALLMSGAEGSLRRIYTDNRGATVSASGGAGQRVVTAGWEGQALVVETRLPSEARIVERYRLVGSPAKLWVDTLVQMPGNDTGSLLKRVYERTGPAP